MSYIDELKAKDFSASIFPTDGRLFEACAEVDRLRTDLAAAEVSAEQAKQSETDCRQIIDTYVDETDCLRTDLAAARAEAERAKGELVLRVQYHEDSVQEAAKQIGLIDDRLAASESRCAALAKENEALRKDKERLDWIEEHHAYSGGGQGGTYTFDVPLDSEDMRQQIDAARADATEGAK